MSARKVYDVVAITGKYTDTEGKERLRFMNCGAVLEFDDGKRKLKLEGLPVNFDGWLQLYEPRSKGENWQQQTDEDKDTPF